HTRFSRDWSSDVCSSDLHGETRPPVQEPLSRATRTNAEKTGPLSVSAGEGARFVRVLAGRSFPGRKAGSGTCPGPPLSQFGRRIGQIFRLFGHFRLFGQGQ